MDHCDDTLEADDDDETDEKIGRGGNDGDYHYLQNFGTSCVCVCVCVFCFLCPECAHNLNRLLNAYSAALHNLQRSSILNYSLLFMLMPIFSSVCIMYGSLCFFV